MALKINPFSTSHPKLSWQRLKSSSKSVPEIFRSPVPGGWLISHGIDGGLTFVPDPSHDWDGHSLSLTD